MIMMPLMRYWNSLKENDIYGYRGKSIQDSNFTYYHNKLKNEYYCNRITAYETLTQKHKNVFILTNSMSYYNKYKNQYPVKFVEYFYYDDYVINQRDKIWRNNPEESQIINDFVFIFLNNFDREFFKKSVKYIAENTNQGFVFSEENKYLDKKWTHTERLSSILKEPFPINRIKTYPNCHRSMVKHNYNIDLPMSNDVAMEDMCAISFYPFHYRRLLDEQFLYLIPSNYIENKDTYDYLEKQGYLEKLSESKFIKFGVKYEKSDVYFK